MADDRCPSCLGDTRVAKARTLSSVQLRAGAIVPDVCIHCGNFTADRSDFTHERTIGGENILLRLLVFVWNPIWYVVAGKNLTGESRSASFSVPICSLCRRAGRTVQPKFVNSEHRTLTLIVHSDFAAALHQLHNDRASSDDAA